MAKIALISPISRFNGYRGFSIIHPGLIGIGTILKENGHIVTVYDENRRIVFNEKTNRVRPEIINYDFVGVSVMTPNVIRGMKILDAVKKQKPGIKTMAGGPHATFMPEEVAEHADVVVKGEAEEVIVKALDLEGIIEGKPADLDKLPSPDFTLLDHYEKRTIGERIFGRVVPINTARGCPYNCNFCSVWKMFGRTMRMMSEEKEKEERERIYRQGTRVLFYVDDYFSASKESKEREEHLEMMIKQAEKGIRLRATVQDGAGIIRKGKDYIRKMRKANIRNVMLGVESFDEKALRSYKKAHTVEETKRCIKELNKNGIAVHAFCIIGGDEDTEESVRKMPYFLKKLGVKTAQFSILTPLPGTRLYKQVQERIAKEERDWNLYDGLSVIFEPLNMSREAVQKYMLRNWKKYYSWMRALSSLFHLDLNRFGKNLYGIYLTKKIEKLSGFSSI